MKRSLWIVLGILTSLIIAAGAYFWASGLMDSIYAYRSPLHAQPPAHDQPTGKPITRRVVFVLIDALRADTSLKSDVMPNLNELRQKGAWATMHSRPPSYSEPGYTVLLTGAWPDVSDGPTINLEYEEIPTWTQDNLFSAASRAGLKTAVSGFYWFEKLIPQEAVSASFYTPGEDRNADIEVTDHALPWLKNGDYQLVLIHLDQVDYAGHHEGGPVSPNWDAAAHRADALLGQIAATLDLNQDTLFVCSDHGQIDQGGHGGQDPITLVEPFVLVGAGVKPGAYGDVQMVDVAPTLAAMLGTNVPASSQGHVRTEMLDLNPTQLQKIDTAVAAQQSQLLDGYEKAIGQNVATQPGADPVASTQMAMDTARNNRLNAERIPRAVVALLAALLPAVFLLRKRGPELGWLLACAVLYIILFNVRYAILDGRTYSLSSVTSANDLILYSGTTALFALLVSWAVAVLGLKLVRRGPARASQLVLGLAMVIFYLLSLPVLWSFTLNGALVTWALPDFASSFLGFLSLVQILMVAIIGLVLTGLTALIAWLWSRIAQRRFEEA